MPSGLDTVYATFEHQTAEPDSEVSGRVVDAQTRQGIHDALVLALNPDASLREFMRYRSNSSVFTSEAVKKWGQAPREHAKSPENTTMARSQSPFFHSLSAQTDRDGKFTFPKQLPKGQAYSLVVASPDYEPVAVESVLRVGETAPEHTKSWRIADGTLVMARSLVSKCQLRYARGS